ncbi:MAG: tetratricopeptide repeat protein [Bacteroidota bacterium]
MKASYMFYYTGHALKKDRSKLVSSMYGKQLRAFFVLTAGLFILSTCPITEALANCMDSIQLTNVSDPSELAWLKVEKGEHLIWLQDDYQRARTYFQEALDYGQKKGQIELVQKARLGLASALLSEGKYQQSIDILQEIIPDLPSDSKLLAQAYNILGSNRVKLSKYAKAYDVQLQALNIFQEENDEFNIANTCFGIGTNFFYQGQYKLALEKYTTALDIWQKQDCPKGIYRAYRAMGGCYGYLKQLDQAFNYTQKSLEIAFQLNNKSDIGWTLLNMGATLHDMGKIDKALKNFKAAHKLAMQSEQIPLQCYALEGITVIYKEQKKYKEALEALDESFAIASKNNDRSTISGFYKLYAEIYFQLEDFSAYKDNIDRHLALKDSIFHDELANSLGSLQKNFEIQELERKKEIELLKKDSQISYMKLYIWLSVIAGIVLAVLLFIALLRYRNRHIREMNEMLRTKNEQIIRQNEQLTASNKDLRQYAYIISHDLKEPLRNISSFTTLLKRRLPTYRDPSIDEFMGFITKGVQQMNTLLTDLIEYSRINRSLEKIQYISTEEVVQEVVESLTYKIKEVDAKVAYKALPEIYFNKTHFTQVIQNLVSNALKFRGERKPEIVISCEQRPTEHIFQVKDNGIGIEAEYFDKIFVVFQRLHNRGQYKGSGIGLSTCKKIIGEYGGKIWVESQPGEGTSFFFSIPISSPKRLYDAQQDSSKQAAEDAMLTSSN